MYLPIHHHETGAQWLKHNVVTVLSRVLVCGYFRERERERNRVRAAKLILSQNTIQIDTNAYLALERKNDYISAAT